VEESTSWLHLHLHYEEELVPVTISIYRRKIDGVEDV